MSSKLRLVQTPVDLRDIVCGALEVGQPAAEAKRIDLAVDADPSIGTIYGDGSRLQQIVWNLLPNPSGSRSERARLQVRLSLVAV